VCLVFKPKSWIVIHSLKKCFEYNLLEVYDSISHVH
jgi:hypothetical protein